MPVHPLHRSWSETLKEDREAVILADKLGYYDAFMGEHLTDKAENITNSMMFNASLISDTRQIKLATGTTNLSHMHPVLVAQHAAMFDHMSEGRFILGVSPGALTSDAEALGILEQDRNKMFAEAIDVILAIWERDPPYDIDFPDNRFKVSLARTQAPTIGVGFLGKPYQKPRPEIVGTVVAPFSPGVILMGKRDFHPLSANFLLSKHLKSHWENYCKGKAEVGVAPNRVAEQPKGVVVRPLDIVDEQGQGPYQGERRERDAREVEHAERPGIWRQGFEAGLVPARDRIDRATDGRFRRGPGGRVAHGRRGEHAASDEQRAADLLVGGDGDGREPRGDG
jgi:hypothetical protein